MLMMNSRKHKQEKYLEILYSYRALAQLSRMLIGYHKTYKNHMLSRSFTASFTTSTSLQYLLQIELPSQLILLLRPLPLLLITHSALLNRSDEVHHDIICLLHCLLQFTVQSAGVTRPPLGLGTDAERDLLE